MPYTFDKTIEPKHIELIKKAIDICKSLNAPVSDNVYFKYHKGSSFYGWCIYEKDSDKYSISINKYIVEDDEIINTVIHELLHTIEITHKRKWKYWASIVSNNTNFKITRNAFVKLKDEAYAIANKRNNDFKVICYCPFCKRKYLINSKKIYNHKTSDLCRWCYKNLYDELPDSILKDMKNEDRNIYLETRIFNRDISKEELYNFLNYTNEQMTRSLIRYYVTNLELDYVTSVRISKHVYERDFGHELTMNYIHGAYDSKITNLDKLYSFDKLIHKIEYIRMIRNYYDAKQLDGFAIAEDIRGLNEKFYFDLLKCQFLDKFIEIFSSDSFINITTADIRTIINGKIVGALYDFYNDVNINYKMWPVINNKRITDVILNIVTKSGFENDELNKIINNIKSQFGEVNIIFSHSINEGLLPLYCIRALFVNS